MVRRPPGRVWLEGRQEDRGWNAARRSLVRRPQGRAWLEIAHQVIQRACDHQSPVPDIQRTITNAALILITFLQERPFFFFTKCPGSAMHIPKAYLLHLSFPSRQYTMMSRVTCNLLIQQLLSAEAIFPSLVWQRWTLGIIYLGPKWLSRAPWRNTS